MKVASLDRRQRQKTIAKMMKALDEIQHEHRKRWWQKIIEFFRPTPEIYCDFCNAGSRSTLVYEPFSTIENWQMGYTTICVKCATGKDPKKPGDFAALKSQTTPIKEEAA